MEAVHPICSSNSHDIIKIIEDNEIINKTSEIDEKRALSVVSDAVRVRLNYGDSEVSGDYLSTTAVQFSKNRSLVKL